MTLLVVLVENRPGQVLKLSKKIEKGGKMARRCWCEIFDDWISCGCEDD